MNKDKNVGLFPTQCIRKIYSCLECHYGAFIMCFCSVTDVVLSL